MKKTLLLILIGIINFVIINQFLIPGLGCGSTLLEFGSLFSIVILIMLNYKLIIKILKFKKPTNEKV